MAKEPFGVLILHGFSSSLDSVRCVEPPLQELGLPTRLPTLRGHGAESPDALRGVAWREWVADAEVALQDLLTEVERAIVFGHSTGGLVALTLAAENADVIDSIVLAAAAVQHTSLLAPGRPLHFLAPLAARVLNKVDMPPTYADPELARHDTNYRWVPVDAALMFLQFTRITRRRLPEVEVPALIMQGRNDTIVAPESADIIYSSIATPRAKKRLVWFDVTEHEMLQDCERQIVVDTIMGWVRQRTGRATQGTESG